MDREKRPTVGVPVREGGRVRFSFKEDHVLVLQGHFGPAFRVEKDHFREVVEAAIDTWGRALHPGQGITGVVMNFDLEESTRILVDDVCNNCGSGFGVNGDLPHYPQQVGVCLIGELTALPSAHA